MITPQKTTSKYRAIEPYLEIIRNQVRQTIHAFSDKKGFAVLSRVKTLESLSEKIEDRAVPFMVRSGRPSRNHYCRAHACA